ncbi:MAG: 16S rRNA (adenine(1518)-N(6)/adenine(1519)-N(6))-dimethyltransferase RsmA [Candidatus Komeilibacteria bacterium]
MGELLEQTKYLIRAHKIKPGFVAGQNFLICEDILEAILESSDIQKEDNVLEIGPGLGVMTKELIKKAGKVLAVEYDKQLIPLIQKLADVNNNLQIINEDILRVKNDKIAEHLTEDYMVVANIPYQITSKIIQKFLTFEPKPSSLTLLVQKEVAERIVAKAGDLSKLAISVQFYGVPKIVRIVPKTCFWPEPKVDSAVIQIVIDNRFLDIIKKEKVSEKDFWSVVKSGFSNKRKTLVNNLSNSLHLDKEVITNSLNKLKLDQNIRAQELSIDDWIHLSKLLI